MSENNPSEPAQVSPDKLRQHALSEAQITHLTATARLWVEAAHGTPTDIALAHRDYSIALLLIFSGITVNEVCSLKLEHFALNDQGARYLQAGMPVRKILLNRDTHQAISRWLVLRKLVYGAWHVDALFVTRAYDPIRASSVKQVMHRLRKDSSIAFTNFSLRHAFIRRMIAEGHPANEISGMLSRPSRDIIDMYAATRAATDGV